MQSEKLEQLMKLKRISKPWAVFGVILCGLCIYVFTTFLFLPGRCSSLSQLPSHGRVLPERFIGDISYMAKSGTGTVYAKVSTTSQEFDQLVKDLKLDAVRYGTGFDDSEFEVEPKQFCPSGSRVWCGFGPLYAGGRYTIRLYFDFEPEGDDDSKGVLYIHIS